MMLNANKKDDLIYEQPARGCNLVIKTQKKWKYDDNFLNGCNKNEESGDGILFWGKY